MIEPYNENATQKTTFWGETFKYIIYILQGQQPAPRLKLENLMVQYANETTKAIMDTTLTNTFWLIAKIFEHTIYNR